MNCRKKVTAAVLFLAAFAGYTQAAEPTRNVDLLIVNGSVIDGSGSDRQMADVAVSGDTIVAVGTDLAQRFHAERTIDASGQVVAPGYIDVHTHADRVVLGDDEKRRAARNLLYQGITTVNIGADGRHSRKFADEPDGQIARQYAYIDEHPFGMNVFILLGHDNIRKTVMGDDNFQHFSSQREMSDMADLVRKYVAEGALGMSLGLEYQSGRWSDEEELVYLARALAEIDKRAVIIAHERATGRQHRYYIPSNHNRFGLYGDRFRKYPDGWDVIDYINEGIRIAEQSGLVYDFTHLKVTHQSYWGKSREIIDLINAARDRGVKVYAEQIAFNNSGNSPMNLSLIPAKYYGDDKFHYWALARSLNDPRKKRKLRADIAWQIDKQGGVDSVRVIDSNSHPEWIGKSLRDLAGEFGLNDAVDTLLRVKELGDDDKANGARFRSVQTLSPTDTANFAKQDWFGTVTDAGIYDLDGGFAQPRVFASFTNKITEFVQERGAITLEHAIRAGTGLPAEMLSLPDRGLLRKGYKADIQVFDPEALSVNARWSLEDSRAYSSGMQYVIVNGVLALDAAEPTYNLAGRSIRNRDVWVDSERSN